MVDHLPECYQFTHWNEHFDGYWCNEDCTADCICDRLGDCEQRVLHSVIQRAELTFRSDTINPVRDVVEPMLEDK